MVELSISEISKHPKILEELREIAKVVNKKSRKVRGIFVPVGVLGEEFDKFIERIERESREQVLRRIAEAQKLDPIEDGAVGDGL